MELLQGRKCREKNRHTHTGKGERETEKGKGRKRNKGQRQPWAEIVHGVRSVTIGTEDITSSRFNSKAIFSP